MRPHINRDEVMSQALARRIACLQDLPIPDRLPEAGPVRPSSLLLRAVEDALLQGETHYTVRPGMPELRRRLLAELAAMGGPACERIDSALITAGEAESIFLLLPDFRSRPGVVLTGCSGACRHRFLFELMGLRLHPAGEDAVSGNDIRLAYREWAAERGFHELLLEHAAGVPDVLNLGSWLASDRGLRLPPHLPDRTIFVGDFDALPGVAAFRVGFLAGPEPLVRRAAVWRQAFSICSPGPSQRAALQALTAWQEGSR
jgi:DNA-binding transcriptional MocR family regulator